MTQLYAEIISRFGVYFSVESVAILRFNVHRQSSLHRWGAEAPGQVVSQEFSLNYLSRASKQQSL